VQAISIHDWDSMEKVKKLLNKIGDSKIAKIAKDMKKSKAKK
jgi:hypothetical protein